MMKVNKYPKYEVEIYTKKINQMTVVFIPKENHNSIDVSLSVNYGSVDINYLYNNKEYKSYLGAAHFLEHKIFELPDGSDAFNLLSSYGADANAYTTYDETVYLFSCTDNLFKCFDVFLNYILTNTLNDKTINLEKGIIVEELMMYLDKPTYQIQERMMSMMYKDNYINKPILGTKDSINAMDEETLSTIYDAFYNPGNMVLHVTGNFNVNEVEEYLEKELNKYKFNEFNTKKLFPKEQEEVVTSYEEFPINSDVNYVSLGVKLNPNITNNFLKNVLILECFVFMLFSRNTKLMDRLIKEEILFNDYSFDLEFNENYSFIKFFSVSDKQDILIKELENLFLNFEKTFDEEDFILSKKSSYSNFIYFLDNLTDLAEDITLSIQKGYDYFEYTKVLETITKEDVINFANKIKKQHLSFIKTKKK